MGLFSKKPGGTFFGNLLRGVGSAVSGGLLGKGMHRVEVGQTKTNKQLLKEAKAAAEAGGTPPTMIAPPENRVTTIGRNLVGSITNIGSGSYDGSTIQPAWNPIEVDENGKAHLNVELPKVQGEVGIANSPILWIAGGLLLLTLLKR